MDVKRKTTQVKVSLPPWAWDLAKRYFNSHKEKLAEIKPPIKSTTKLITFWIQQGSDFYTMVEKYPGILTPRMEHFNTYKDHVTIRDHKLGLYVDVYPKPDGRFYCDYDKVFDCSHIQFLLVNKKEILSELQEKGWKYKG